jgi:hypothetical protein
MIIKFEVLTLVTIQNIVPAMESHLTGNIYYDKRHDILEDNILHCLLLCSQKPAIEH